MGNLEQSFEKVGEKKEGKPVEVKEYVPGAATEKHEAKLKEAEQAKIAHEYSQEYNHYIDLNESYQDILEDLNKLREKELLKDDDPTIKKLRDELESISALKDGSQNKKRQLFGQLSDESKEKYLTRVEREQTGPLYLRMREYLRMEKEGLEEELSCWVPSKIMRRSTLLRLLVGSIGGAALIGGVNIGLTEFLKHPDLDAVAGGAISLGLAGVFGIGMLIEGFKMAGETEEKEKRIEEIKKEVI